MKKLKKIKYLFLSSLLLAAVNSSSISAMPPLDDDYFNNRTNNRGISLAPDPTTIDQITHNKGNIVTTIDNWGYIGGYSYYGLPSGEWPRNSGHSYLAEIRYWMGAINAVGDTLVANSYDDFQYIPMPINGVDDYKIYLSTDTSRYYNYDLTDTVGLGDGNPARGWRVWDNNNVQWDYNVSYNSLSSSFKQGGPTSLQDSYYRFNDAALGSSLLGLELTHKVLQWNYCYNEDFLFVVLEITNTSVNDYAQFAFGLYVDIDVGGNDGMGGNGRQEDVVVYDSTENLAYIYDVVGIDPGWGPTVQTGFMGTKLLETPNNVGMTAFRTDDWAFLPNDDAGRFAMINSTQFDASLPPTDQFYIQCVRGVNLTAGSTVRVVYALIAGADSADFVDNASMAQQLYDNYFVGPQPPPTPTLNARASDRKIFLNWNDTSEVGLDPLSGVNDFVGYKLYRSDNQGKTWGVVNYQTNNNCLDVDYTPISTYTVNNPSDPIPHSFIDTGLYNGVEYWYCLAAFDKGDSTIDPLQSGFGIAGEVSNIIAVTPSNFPAGHYEADGTVIHNYIGTDSASEGEIIPVVFDEDSLLGAEYQVVFEDTPTKTYWHLINSTTGDTLLANQTTYNNDPGMSEIVEGLRVVVRNPEVLPKSYEQTGMGGSSTTLEISSFEGPLLVYWMGSDNYTYGYAQYRATYELRYTTDSTVAPSMWEYFDGTTYPLTPIPFEVWNLSTNQRVSLALDEWPIDGAWQPGDGLIIVDYPYDPLNDLTTVAFPNYYGWRFTLVDSIYTPSLGDILTIEGAPLNGPDDIFTFKIDAVDNIAARNELKDIRVVPNPYFVQYSSMVETAEGESILEFQKVPGECTIRIYTLAGDLVKTIIHNDGTGTARWDLMSKHNQLISSGIYFFHLESNVGEHLGRFAIIK